MPRSNTFFKQAINNYCFPHKVVADKNGANFAGLENINMSPILTDLISFIEICPVNYLNNMVEQGHRFIKKKTPCWDAMHFIQRRRRLSIALKLGHETRETVVRRQIPA